MSSLSPKDRVSLCSFTFSDGRRCRTPRISSHPHFCFYHAQKEARACAVDKLGKDLAYFFSGDYLSACDLSTALARLIPAVVRGDVKPKTARTVAYLAQTLMQAIHISQHEYCEAFDTDDWRQAIRNSVKGNYDYRFPPAPAPAPEQPAPLPPPPQPQPVPVAHPARGEAFGSTGATSSVPSPTPPQQPAPHPAQTPINCHSERSDERPTMSASPACPEPLGESYREESASSSNSSLATRHSSLPQQPAPSPHPPLPPTSAEFAQQVLAGLPRSMRPGSTGETGGGQAPQPAPAPQPATSPAETPVNCHSGVVAQAFRPEESASSSNSTLVTRHFPNPLNPGP